MEWYSIIIIIGIFLLWSATSIIIWIFNQTFSRFVGIQTSDILLTLFDQQTQYHDILFLREFLVLLGYFPNFLLVGLYMMYNLPENEWFKTLWFWEYLRNDYFSYKVEGEQKQDKQIMYAVFPHGVYAAGAAFYFTLNPKYNLNTKTIATSLLFWIPIVRECASLAGVVPANTKEIIDELDKGNNVLLLPEGLRGLLHRDDPCTVLKKRKGFIRCAVTSANSENIAIVPVYIKGGNELYNVFFPWRWAQGKLLSKFYYPWPVLCWGAWWCPFFPKSKQLTVCFGEPIDVYGKSVNEIHSKFMIQANELIQQQATENT